MEGLSLLLTHVNVKSEIPMEYWDFLRVTRSKTLKHFTAIQQSQRILSRLL